MRETASSFSDADVARWDWLRDSGEVVAARFASVWDASRARPDSGPIVVNGHRLRCRRHERLDRMIEGTVVWRDVKRRGR